MDTAQGRWRCGLPHLSAGPPGATDQPGRRRARARLEPPHSPARRHHPAVASTRGPAVAGRTVLAPGRACTSPGRQRQRPWHGGRAARTQTIGQRARQRYRPVRLGLATRPRATGRTPRAAGTTGLCRQPALQRRHRDTGRSRALARTLVPRRPALRHRWRGFAPGQPAARRALAGQGPLLDSGLEVPLRAGVGRSARSTLPRWPHRQGHASPAPAAGYPR
ncbi:hypothetical protein D3C79_804420 [compost metagenome]